MGAPELEEISFLDLWYTIISLVKILLF
ncbi:hypothetical protein RSK20926_07758 [Roseobacter sp. SK209-2-6]|nr:hypothetical protein RSK20926_07758 [Roseobacter sp. SK209-2-6]